MRHGMSPQVDRSDQGGPDDQTTSNEIARSLGNVWYRFSGRRPSTMSVEVSQDAVRCVIEDGPAEGATGDGVSAGADSELCSSRFGYDATAAITRATGRRVIAFIPKRDRDTRIVTQTYIFDPLRPRF
jgi:hypothetical protein